MKTAEKIVPMWEPQVTGGEPQDFAFDNYETCRELLESVHALWNSPLCPKELKPVVCEVERLARRMWVASYAEECSMDAIPSNEGPMPMPRAIARLRELEERTREAS